MKLLFSETAPDYSRYQYPYVIWAVPEPGETPADFFAAGFLPASPQLDRFYLCRQLRLPLAQFQPTSENRRILRKGAAVSFRLVPRAEFACTPECRTAWLAYAAERFGDGVMSAQRLDTLMSAPVISHLLVFTDAPAGREVGTALLFLQPPRVAFYYYAFYDLAWADRSLGMFMMTSAVKFFAEQGFAHLHLGTCYSERALYKTQFPGVEYFNGFAWSGDLAELKRTLRRDTSGPHLLEEPEFQAAQGGWPAIVAATRFRSLLSAPLPAHWPPPPG